MDDPVSEITDIVHSLIQGSPKEQADAINTYFTTNASFTHPFCRTGSFEGSRLLIHAIFRWYKIMSPRIEGGVDGIAFDEKNLRLYLSIHQTFAIWLLPFHRAPVNLTTVLQLTHRPSTSSSAPLNKNRYYIESQNDLYQIDQFLSFILPWGLAQVLVYSWHFIATGFCVLGAVLFAWLTNWEERYAEGKLGGVGQVVVGGLMGVEGRRMRRGDEGGRRGVEEVADGVQEVAERVRGEVVVGLDGRNGVNGAAGCGDRDQRPNTEKQQFGKMQVVT